MKHLIFALQLKGHLTHGEGRLHAKTSASSQTLRTLLTIKGVQPSIERYLAEHAGYQTNRYQPLEPKLQEEITRRWGDVIRRYGYEREK